MAIAKRNFMMKLTFLSAFLLLTNICQAVEENWQTKIIPQLYFQNYNGSIARKNTTNTGITLISDYLDSDKIRAGYYNTITNLFNQAEVSENMLYLSGQHNMFLDIAPGNLTFRLDAYLGKSTLKYNISTPPGNIGGGGMGNSGKQISGATAIVTETVNMTAVQPQLGYSNYAKTFYADIGYAYSKYKGSSITEVKQLTPTIAFGWNDSYDWLQFRAYFIDVNDTTSTYNKNKFESIEVKYTYWLRDSNIKKIENIRFSILTGERVLAVDSDASVVYSNADMQKGSVEASVLWTLSKSSKLLTSINYSRYNNQSLADNYNSLLFYLNYQHQW